MARVTWNEMIDGSHSSDLCDELKNGCDSIFFKLVLFLVVRFRFACKSAASARGGVVFLGSKGIVERRDVFSSSSSMTFTFVQHVVYMCVIGNKIFLLLLSIS